MKPALMLLLGVLALFPAPATQSQEPGRDEPRPTASFDDMQQAQGALEELMRAYESGNVLSVQNRLDPGMIGYQRFVDGMQRDVAALKQIRINLFETQITAGPDVAMIQGSWEKRFFGVAGYTPGIFTGRSTFLMHRDKAGWRLAAVAGDNPFSSESGALAVLTLQPPTLAIGRVVGSVAVRIELVDPDLAGLARVTVEVSTSHGDREGVVLDAVAPGQFLRTTLPMARVGAVAPGNGTVEFLAAGPFPATVSVRYVDANPGANRPPTTLARSLVVQ